MDIYDRLLVDAVGWARMAGAIQLQDFRGTTLDASAKLNESDIVTRVDRACDAMLTSAIAEAYPDHAILAEESGIHEGADSEWRWVIDPLDGTTNYAAGLPVFAVSIGIEHHGEPMVGVVYAPRLDELFTAVRGRGAMLNGEPIQTGSNSQLARAVVATGFPVDRDVCAVDNVAEFGRVLHRVRAVRTIGSAAMDLCYSACGVLDGYWEMNLRPWDVCAGALILEESGGCVAYYRTDRQVSVCAGNQYIQPQLLELITSK